MNKPLLLEFNNKKFHIICITLITVFVLFIIWQLVYRFFYRENNNTSPVLKTEFVPSEQSIILNPSPIINTSNDWMTYTNKELGFSLNYPPQWSLTITQTTKQYFNVSMSNSTKSQHVLIYNEPTTFATGTIHEKIEKYVDFITKYTPSISYYSPTLINQSEIYIDGKKAFKYVFKLHTTLDNDKPNYDNVTYIFVFNGDDPLFTVILEGDDQDSMSQVANSIKFDK
jgi:hypothetical protein